MHCRKASHLLSDAQDRELSRSERIALVFHLSMCSHCRRFSKQIKTLRQASKVFRDNINKPEE